MFQDTILEILVASGADLDSKTNDSRTPLGITWSVLHNAIFLPLSNHGSNKFYQ
jgi:hypothetical protein